MALSPGDRLGVYEVTAELGAGGMGIVYRAHDTKLGRDVALKVLPDLFADDPERLGRFQREARVLASLNHPNIASIYGLEESGDTRALVLELVEGPTLAERIAQGAIPVEEALPIAKQIADALEAAHERGVIHRDLKPANVKVKTDGMVKVLDFGLAKALAPTPIGDPSESPTLTAAATQMGVILGTAAYMAPEQARGKPVDKRADIWAFGAVLYEMLTGTRAFDGSDVGETLAAVIQSSPQWAALPSPTGSALDTLIRRCLEKDPQRRLRDIGEARIALDQGDRATLDPASGSAGAAPGLSRRWATVVVCVAIGMLAGVLGMRLLAPAAQDDEGATTLRVSIPAPGLAPPGDISRSLAISQDGRAIVYQAGRAQGQLHLLRLETSDVTILADGANSAVGPVFSPDGDWVGYSTPFQGDALWRAPALGGPAARITSGTDSGAVRGTAWGDDGQIYVGGIGLSRVAADGGPIEQLTELRDGETAHILPAVLPQASGVLFTAVAGQTAEVSVLSLETGTRRTLLAGQAPQFTASGHLLYLRDGQLFAVGFDPRALELTGTPVAMEVARADERVEAFSVSEAGTLAFATSRGFGMEGELVWVDRRGGNVESVVDDRADFHFPWLSPDDQRVAVNIYEGGDPADIWVYDIARGTRDRLTREGSNVYAAWSSDGDRIAFGSQRAGSDDFDLYWRPSDGSGTAERWLSRPHMQLPMHWLNDGTTLSFVDVTPGGNWDVWQVSSDGEATPLVSRPGIQGNHSFAPGEDYLAYNDSHSGNFEDMQISVEPYQTAGRRLVVSGELGVNEPRWSPSGRELFYRSGDGSRMMVVPVDPGPPLTFGTPELLFEGNYRVGNLGGVNYDVSSDGERFLMVRSTSESDPEAGRIHLVVNWFDELNRLVPLD